MSDKVRSIYEYKCKHYEEYKKSCWRFSLNGNTCPALDNNLVELGRYQLKACSNGKIYVDWTTNLTKKDIIDKHYILLYD